MDEMKKFNTLLTEKVKELTKENTKLIKKNIKCERVKEIYSKSCDEYIEDIEKLTCELHEWREKYYHLKIVGKDEYKLKDELEEYNTNYYSPM